MHSLRARRLGRLAAIAVLSATQCPLEAVAFWVVLAEQQHGAITEQVLRHEVSTRLTTGRTVRFSAEAIEEVRQAVEFPDDASLDARFHFDNEEVKAGSALLVWLRSRIREHLVPPSSPGLVSDPDGVAARFLLGLALHTVQDFYAHSNWLELNGGPVLLSDTLGVREFGSEPHLIGRTCDEEGTELSSLLRLDAALNDLTTGYAVPGRECEPVRVPDDPQDPDPEFTFQKCLHGSLSVLATGLRNPPRSLEICPFRGVAKDDPIRALHDSAGEVAREATLEFVSLVLDDIEDDDLAICALLGLELSEDCALEGRLRFEYDRVRTELAGVEPCAEPSPPDCTFPVYERRAERVREEVVNSSERALDFTAVRVGAIANLNAGTAASGLISVRTINGGLEEVDIGGPTQSSLSLTTSRPFENSVGLYALRSNSTSPGTRSFVVAHPDPEEELDDQGNLLFHYEATVCSLPEEELAGALFVTKVERGPLHRVYFTRDYVSGRFSFRCEWMNQFSGEVVGTTTVEGDFTNLPFDSCTDPSGFCLP